MSAKTVARDLDLAADYLAEYGHCRGAWYTAKGRVCLAGAVALVTGALKPKTPEQIEAEIQKELSYSYVKTRTQAKSLVSVYRFNRNNKRYHAAVTALAHQINPARSAAQHDGGSIMFQEDVVIGRNDGGREDGDKFVRTTKTTAVKLLRQAAESVRGGTA